MHVQRLRSEAPEKWGESDHAFIGDEDRSVVVAVQSVHLFSYAQCLLEPQTVDATKSVQIVVRSYKSKGGKDLPFEDFLVHA